MNSPLLTFFIDIEQFLAQALPADWHQLLIALRRHGLLAKAYYQLGKKIEAKNIPEPVYRQLRAGAKYADKQQQSLFYELFLLESLSEEVKFPCLLLKGAAYRALALPMSYGRLFSDIDILVPADCFNEMRNKLFFKGFYEPAMSDYDRHYYLKWSHQNPPLHHFERDTVIDLHHQIFPTASALKLNIKPFFEKAIQIKGSYFKVPCIEHLFVHAAVHLFLQEETHRSVKDIIDINALFNEVAKRNLSQSLQEQSALIGAESAVINAVYVIEKLFKNADAAMYLQTYQRQRPSKLVCQLMLKVLNAKPDQYSFAKNIWFIRGHFLKLKWHILLYHFIAKPLSKLHVWASTTEKPRRNL